VLANAMCYPNVHMFFAMRFVHLVSLIIVISTNSGIVPVVNALLLP